MAVSAFCRASAPLAGPAPTRIARPADARLIESVSRLRLYFETLKRFFFILVLFVLAGATGVYIDWIWKRPLSPRGGRYFFHRLELAVPSFRQGDERWREDPLGGVEENGTMGSAGCAVASAAMVFQSYGIKVDPQQLNWFLTATGGYTDEGWLYWDRAAWWAPDQVRHVYEDLPSYQLIDSNLGRGNPVIVRVRFPSRVTHFVVIAGKEGFDYLIRDPGAGAAKGLYPLRELGSDIEALRFYESLANVDRRHEWRDDRCVVPLEIRDGTAPVPPSNPDPEPTGLGAVSRGGGVPDQTHSPH